MMQLLLSDTDTTAIHNEKIKVGSDVMKNVGLLLFASGFIKPYIEGGEKSDVPTVVLLIWASVLCYVMAVRMLNELEAEEEK